MIFVGDVHGEFAMYRDRIGGLGRSIQVGDMGIGFGADDLYKQLVPPEHLFIRGNHDNPQKCLQLPQYMGNFGYLKDDEIFFVSGALSIDRHARTPHVNWWEEEELSALQMRRAVDLYREVKPKIVATHDCPYSAYDQLYPKRLRQISMTATMLEVMFSEHQPQAWVFGHHHRSRRFAVGETAFFGLGILEVINLMEVKLPEGVEHEDVDLHDGVSKVGKINARD